LWAGPEKIGRAVRACTGGGRIDLGLHQDGLLVLNEPETSLHSDLLAPLAQLINDAAAHSQIIVVSHSRALITALGRAARRGGTELSTIRK
jgi:predicted ATP-dependent endonuclease of OLD family